MKNKVHVFVLIHGAPHKSHVSHLNSLFNDRIFDVHLKTACTTTHEERILNCLKESWRKDPEAYCLVLTDRVLSICNDKVVAETIKKCVSIHDFDLAYLFKYNDRCQMHSELANYGTISIVNSHSPNGLEAILYSPSGRDMILGKRSLKNKKLFSCKKGLESLLRKNIYDGNLRCIATTPNLFQYDILNNSLSYKEYHYRNECIPLQLTPKAASVSGSRVLIVLVFIFLLIVATAWALLQLNKC